MTFLLPGWFLPSFWCEGWNFEVLWSYKLGSAWLLKKLCAREGTGQWKGVLQQTWTDFVGVTFQHTLSTTTKQVGISNFNVLLHELPFWLKVLVYHLWRCAHLSPVHLSTLSSSHISALRSNYNKSIFALAKGFIEALNLAYDTTHGRLWTRYTSMVALCMDLLMESHKLSLAGKSCNPWYMLCTIDCFENSTSARQREMENAE